ncbi:MAG: DUF1573 domain-containing protein [Bacteroidales bacterium]|nr:DUF1573 domain-containing protein [Bacteroidales bacterium]
MKKIASAFLTLMMTISLISSAQSSTHQTAYIEFDKVEHDYGTIKESDGPSTATFTFKNTGSSPLVITDVKPSCGCTSPEWSREPIAPGKTGYIKAAYDPANRPGVFNKTIKVMSNAENNTIILRIKGDVIGREKGVEDMYPIVMGKVRLETNHLAFQKISFKETRTDTIGVYNPGDAAVGISFQRIPKHITLKTLPVSLKPKEKGLIIITYNAQSKEDWGFVIDRIPVVFDNNFDPKNREENLTISADIQDDFGNMTEAELAKAPKIEFESKVFDFGTLKQGENKSSTYKFKNTGKSDLIIRKVKASCGCTAVAPDDKIIPPGGESKIDVTFRSAGKNGKQNKTITVITNDPTSPDVTLKVTGDITPNN